ncbi:MAG: HD domain-containing protein [Phycisphaerae bacterium]|nr:HD domain-containing protein [Phycisphaerae bacterium]
MAHKMISEINPGETINDVYLVRNPILRSTSKGDPYIAMFLCDRSGQLNGRMWQASETIYNSLPKPGFIHVKGKSELYQSNLQIIINQVTPIDSSKIDLGDFIARTKNDVNEMFAESEKILDTIENAKLKALVDAFLADETLMENFKNCPAAVKLHHGYLGGLLEHTHSMLKVAAAILPLYPAVNRDIVLTGVFLHDIGKTEELCYDMAFSYTDSGQLIGHLAKGLLMINKKCEELAVNGIKIDADIIDSLGHIILAHHGQYEFGSPKLPATAEAFMVNYIDDLDAKINQVTNLIETDGGEENWTGFQNALQTRLYRKQIQ